MSFLHLSVLNNLRAYDIGDGYKNVEKNIFQQNINEPWRVNKILAVLWLKAKLDGAVRLWGKIVGFQNFLEMNLKQKRSRF